MKLSIYIAGTEATKTAGIPSAYGKEVEITPKERASITIGDAIRVILEDKLNYYRKFKPVMIVKTGERELIIDKIPGRSATPAEAFTAVNKEIVQWVMNLLTTTEQIMDPMVRNTDKVYNNLCQAFGHKGTSITVMQAQADMKQKFAVVQRVNKWASKNAKERIQVPQEVASWETKVAEQKKIESASKLLTETSAK